MRENGPNIISYNIRLVKAKDRQRTIYDISDEIRKDLAEMPEIHRFVVMPEVAMPA
jgi:HAE1 family hydrophobic/amphiphilic exporter-1